MQNSSSFKNACQQKRQQIEAARTVKTRLLHKDVQKIVKREVEFARQVIDLIVPVRVVWDDDAWDRIKDYVPVRVESKQDANLDTDEEPSE
jgi:ribosomal protein L16/L10AE